MDLYVCEIKKKGKEKKQFYFKQMFYGEKSLIHLKELYLKVNGDFVIFGGYMGPKESSLFQ